MGSGTMGGRGWREEVAAGRFSRFGVSDARVKTLPSPGLTCLQQPTADMEEDSPRPHAIPYSKIIREYRRLQEEKRKKSYGLLVRFPFRAPYPPTKLPPL